MKPMDNNQHFLYLSHGDGFPKNVNISDYPTFSSEPPALKVEDVLAADDDEDDDAEEEGDQHEDDHRVLRSG